jgi:hypothetical protein
MHFRTYLFFYFSVTIILFVVSFSGLKDDDQNRFSVFFNQPMDFFIFIFVFLFNPPYTCFGRNFADFVKSSGCVCFVKFFFDVPVLIYRFCLLGIY